MKIKYQNFQNTHYSFRIRQKEQKEIFPRIKHYQLGQVLGKGGFATVYKGIQIFTKSQVAIKVVNLEGLSKKQLTQLQQEIQIQKNLKHPNIIRIYEVIQTESKLYLILELVKGKQLFEHISKFGPLKQRQTAKIFFQICSAVKYLHKNSIAHRDIKTQNIMIDSQFNAKLIDFGLAKNFAIEKDHFLETFCGSPSYTAPELLQKKRYDGKMVDIWCLGVALYVMLEASLPFDYEGQGLRKQNIHKLNWQQPRFSSSQANNIYKMVFKKSYERSNVQQILEATFFEKYLLNRISTQIIDSDQQIAVQVSKNSQIIQRICKLLGKSQFQVKLSILQKVLNSSYALYQLLKLKTEAFQSKNQSLEIKHTKRTQQTLQKQRRTLKKIQKTTNSRCQTPSKISQIKIFPLIKDESYSAFLDKQKQKYSKDLKTIQNSTRQKNQKQEIGLRNRFKSKNIFSKQLNMDVKPRLRQDDPQSPRRLIDCIKRYN